MTTNTSTLSTPSTPSRTTSKTALCVPIPGPDVATIDDQLSRTVGEASLLELRCDLWDDEARDQVADLIAGVPLPLLLAVRKATHGGGFHGDEKSRIAVIIELLRISPAFLDIEWDTPLPLLDRLQVVVAERSPDTRIVVSHHDLKATPEELPALDFAMRGAHPLFSNAISKIATTAVTAADALRMLAFAKEANEFRHPTIGICMGKEGTVTRLAAPTTGMPFTFSCIDNEVTTAPGQVPLQEMRSRYRFDELNTKAPLLGLIGDPVTGSRSHITHNRVLQQCGLPGLYCKMRVSQEETAAWVQEAKKLNIKGISVTMPLKEAIIPHLDAVDAEAKVIGAVNTIVPTEQGWVGYNTDGRGIRTAIAQHRGSDWSWKGRRALVLGAGGAAKAAAYTMKKAGAEVIILNRTEEKALQLAQRLSCRYGRLSDLAEESRRGYDLLIQATAVGMTPNASETLVDPAFLLPDALVMEVVWKPPVTTLMRDAASCGCTVVSGIEMFLYQAVEQYLLWYGEALDVKVVTSTIRQALESSL